MEVNDGQFKEQIYSTVIFNALNTPRGLLYYAEVRDRYFFGEIKLLSLFRQNLFARSKMRNEKGAIMIKPSKVVFTVDTRAPNDYQSRKLFFNLESLF